jgi:branched-chain amino acid transport system ATP-binding protein
LKGSAHWPSPARPKASSYGSTSTSAHRTRWQDIRGDEGRDLRAKQGRDGRRQSTRRASPSRARRGHDNRSLQPGARWARRGLSFSVEAGKVVALLGANGAGKSTTLRTISGLLKPAGGDVRFDGRSIAGLGPEAIVRLGIAHVPEGRRVFPGLSVRENIVLGASNRGRIGATELRRESDGMFDLFPDIRPFADALGWTLSGGQQQMVAVARGLMARPRLLPLDEPSLGLAPVIVQNVFAIIREVRRRGTTVLLMEQNARVALSLADRGHVLETGRLAISGKPDELWANDEIRAAYLGGRIAT